MKIGLAGTGRIGAFHAKILVGLPEVDELVLFDVVPESAARVADEVGATTVGSIEELLASGIDGFVLDVAVVSVERQREIFSTALNRLTAANLTPSIKAWTEWWQTKGESFAGTPK